MVRINQSGELSFTIPADRSITHLYLLTRAEGSATCSVSTLVKYPDRESEVIPVAENISIDTPSFLFLKLLFLGNLPPQSELTLSITGSGWVDVHPYAGTTELPD